MKTSPQGIAFLAAHEGIVPGPYLDSVGVWTAYIGHTAAAGAPDPKYMPRGMPVNLDMALADAFAVFEKDLATYEAAVNKAIDGIPNVTQYQFDASVSFHYNTGAIGSATWVKTWRAGDLKTAGDQIMNWRTPSSIIPRREDEQRLWETGEYGDCTATVWGVTTTGKVVWQAVATMDEAEIMAALGAPTEPAIPVLRMGDEGQAVTDLQNLLIAAGLFVGTVDGVFGESTDAAVRYFQSLSGLTIDGVAGEATYRALGA